MRALLLLLLAAPAFAQGPAVGDPAPKFEARTLDGDTLRLGDLRGRHVLLDFWATWCAPCIAGAPRMAALAARHPERLAVVGVALDAADDVRGFVERHGHGWPQIVEPNRNGRPVTDLFGVTGYPTYVLIDPDGGIVWRSDGAGADPEAAVEAALNHGR